MTLLFTAALSAALIGIISSLSAAECNRCIEIRKENEHKTFNNGYVYYEDYLNQQKGNAVAIASDSETPAQLPAAMPSTEAKASATQTPSTAKAPAANAQHSIFEFDLHTDSEGNIKTDQPAASDPKALSPAPKADKPIEPAAAKTSTTSKAVAIASSPISQEDESAPSSNRNDQPEEALINKGDLDTMDFDDDNASDHASDRDEPHGDIDS